MPYGLGLAPWDVLLSDSELETFGNQLSCVNKSRAFALVVSITVFDATRIRTWMIAHGFSDVHPLYVYKPKQNTTGMEWIFAVECMLVGYKGGIRACKLTFCDATPLLRHNLLFGHQVGPKLQHAGEDAVVNTTQKHPNVASAIGRVFCRPGSTALVIGAGSGSEVIGLARVGVNVVGLERDPKQFRGLTDRLTHEMSFSDRALAQAETDQKSIQLLNLLASRFTSLNPDVDVHFEGGQDGTQSDAEAGTPLAPAAVSAEQTLVNCPGCGQACAKTKAQSCAKFSCASAGMHITCMERCLKCGKMFCNSDCVHGHGC